MFLLLAGHFPPRGDLRRRWRDVYPGGGFLAADGSMFPPIGDLLLPAAGRFPPTKI